MIRTRYFPEHNYQAFFIDGKTIRTKLDPNKPITELVYPEFYDIKLTNFCQGKCPYCYQNSLPKEDWAAIAGNYGMACLNLNKFFHSMDKNQRPFQVAIGGGNPNQHPDFRMILSMLHDYGIVPNYTTNGMGLSDVIIAATKRYCGGVAISCHPHLEHYWKPAIEQLRDVKQLNLHIIISGKESIDYFKQIQWMYRGIIKYFVLLPYETAGRAVKQEIDYQYLTKTLKSLDNLESIAFGANFYQYLIGSDFHPSLYEPEIFSKFLDAGSMKLYKSSFNLIEVCR